ncbi:MAG: bifunctional nicotinamide-nucleotide adenylyltransferase/Nudix hydroxylase [Cardiobacteriaceae bacterium]|nr:bifunctional nicotinamide-nucleotide adenylyltransferase/Nudix hydroxylase [Cardiobacteriaceae bacterium]
MNTEPHLFIDSQANALGVLIGRFQPFHLGHLELVRAALTSVDRLLILIGSGNTPRTIKNPFTFVERVEMIEQTLGENELNRVFFASIPDYPYDDAAWCLAVETQVAKIKQASDLEHMPTVLIGHEKDESSYYLKLFPNWKRIEFADFGGYSATPLRDKYLRDGEISTDFPSEVREYLAAFKYSDVYQNLVAERKQIDKEKEAWKNAPYPPIFVTVDALVKHKNEILLIERGRYPGKGLWALPGGFLEEKETMLTSCLRELSEETGISCSQAVWEKFLRKQQIFEAYGRSFRGRVITQVFLFELPADCPRPSICAGDDAAYSFWTKIDELKAENFFDDHFHIIREMLKGIR